MAELCVIVNLNKICLLALFVGECVFGKMNQCVLCPPPSAKWNIENGYLISVSIFGLFYVWMACFVIIIVKWKNERIFQFRRIGNHLAINFMYESEDAPVVVETVFHCSSNYGPKWHVIFSFALVVYIIFSNNISICKWACFKWEGNLFYINCVWCPHAKWNR